MSLFESTNADGRPGRTVYNSSCYGGQSVVWQVDISLNLPEVQSVFGTGEVQRTGKFVLERRTYHLLAGDDPVLAKAGALALFPGDNIVGDIVVKPLCMIDGSLHFGRK